MPKLDERFDITLERVVTAGLPRNRAEWCYKLTLPKGKHQKICIDFEGENNSFTDPGNLDSRSATDSDRMQWAGTSVKKRDPKKPEGPSNKKTLVCLTAKNKEKPFKGGEIELRFIGPADSAGSSKVSIETISYVRESDSATGKYKELDHGQKPGLEAPVMALASGKGMPAKSEPV